MLTDINKIMYGLNVSRIRTMRFPKIRIINTSHSNSMRCKTLRHWTGKPSMWIKRITINNHRFLLSLRLPAVGMQRSTWMTPGILDRVLRKCALEVLVWFFSFHDRFDLLQMVGVVHLSELICYVSILLSHSAHHNDNYDIYNDMIILIILKNNFFVFLRLS